jgi:benzoate-CoA ligase family protein
MNEQILDRVPDDAPGAKEIGFRIPERYNASEILFRNLDAGRAGSVAIRSVAGEVTYGALAAEASRFGAALASLGLARSERVLLFLNDTAAYPAAFFGAVRAGFVPALVNTLSPRDLVRFYLEDSEAPAAIVDGEHAALFDEATVRGTRLRALVVVNGEPSAASGVEVLESARWLAGFPTELDAADTHRDDMAFWMYSSGSTGRPKGIVHLQHDMPYTAESYARHVLGIRENDVCFSVPKIFFAYGFGNSLTFPFAVGASAVLHSGRPEPAPVFDLVARFRPTLFFGLPTLYGALLAHPRAAEADFSSVRLCISAAEPLSHDLFESWRRRFGHEMVEGLGSTEVLHIYLSNAPERKKIGTVGRRVPGYEARLTSPEGEPVVRGEAGVLEVRGHSSAPGYWRRPDNTRETMRAEGWIRTGDRMVEDAEGFFTYVGRADDLIKVSGQWIHPLEIERCLAEHESVRECAVLGLGRTDRRMTTKAFVVLREGTSPGDETTKVLQGFVKGRLLPYKYPRIVEYVDALPKTGTGKIDRQALRERDLK